MKISLNWLKNYIQFSDSVEMISERLTQAGLEIVNITTFESIKGGLAGLIIGHVVTCEQHPNADKLKKTTVDIGATNPLSIVCGDPTVAAGKKVIVAPVGTTIYNHEGKAFTIKKAKIRGEVSEGMLCAEDEIGLSNNHHSIITLDTKLPLGTPASTYLEVTTDQILEVEITPNRADACSHLGVARDLAAILNLPLQWPMFKQLPQPTQALPIHIKEVDPIGCPRYAGIVIRGVVVKDSPTWLQYRLKSIGIKPINNIVDITNYVLHDLGQPLHAFDYDAIVGQEILVKKIGNQEKFTTLDQVERSLGGEELMICDKQGPLCMAGILGGARGSITTATKNIFLESAYFAPTVIRQGAQQHGIKTDASFRFERGVDPNITVYALESACTLLQELANGQVASELMDHYPQKIDNFKVQVTYKNIELLIGHSIPQEKIKNILKSLEISISNEDVYGFIAQVPPYRVDVTREADIIEEIIRIYGYDAIPLTGSLGSTYLSSTKRPAPHDLAHNIAMLLVNNRYNEICTNSLIQAIYGEQTPVHNKKEIVAVLNPLSNSVNVLRNTLLFSGLEVITHNIARKLANLKLFELATIYEKEGRNYTESTQLGVWITGKTMSSNWIEESKNTTFQTLNGIVHQILYRLGIQEFTYEKIVHPYYEEGVNITLNKKVLLTAGSVLPAICVPMEIYQPVYFAAINWDIVLQVIKINKIYMPFSKFPVVKRDLSLVIDQSITFQQIKNIIAQYGSKYIQSVDVFDVYVGENMAINKKAYAITFKLHSTVKTLDCKMIDQIMNYLMHQFETQLGAIIRR